MIDFPSPVPLAEMPPLVRLSAADIRSQIQALTELLTRCVEGGASIGFLLPVSPAWIQVYWQTVATAVDAGERVALALFDQGVLVGSVQLGLAMPQNGSHRTDLGKLLVHPSARGRGYSKVLMRAAEAEARRRGKRLIVLDTEEGSLAEGLYRRLGYQDGGRIPDYALSPEGELHPTVLFFKRVLPTVVREGDPEDPAARILIDRLSADLGARFGSDGRNGFSGWAMAEWKAFAIAESNGIGVGCGAILERPDAPDCAEIKRMYADPQYPGTGTLVLTYLLDQARRRGYRAVCLETRWANRRAIAFYQRHGFRQGPAFPPYEGRPECACLELDL